MWEAESTRCWTADVPKIQKCTGRLGYHGRLYSRSQWQRRFRRPCRKIGLLLERVDSEVVDLVYAMEDMERGLQEMAQSVEHMQEMLKRSPMVQALAQRKPEVRAPSALLSQNGRRGFHQVTLYEATRRCFTHQIAFPTDDGGLSLKNSI